MLSGAVCRVRGRTLLVIRIGSQWVWKNSLIRLWWHQKLTLWPLGLGSAEGCRFPEDPWTCELLPKAFKNPRAQELWKDNTFNCGKVFAEEGFC